MIRRLPILMACVLVGCFAGSRAHLGGLFWGDRGSEPSPRSQAIAHYLTGVVYERDGKLEEAVAEMEKAAVLQPSSASIQLALIRNYMILQDFDSAMQSCKRVLELRPDEPSLWIILGGLHQRLEQHEEAAAAFQQALALQPESVLGYQALVLAEENTNDLTAAIDIYSKLIEFTPYVTELHYKLGLNLVRINDTEGARAALERALDLNPAMLPARYLLGVVYLELDEPERAAVQFRRYLTRIPYDVSCVENLAAALARSGKRAEALEILSVLIQQGTAETRHHIQYLFLLLRSERFEEAGAVVPPTGAPIVGTLLRGLTRMHLDEPFVPLIESLDQIDGDVDSEYDEFVSDLLFLFGEEDTGEFLVSQLRKLGRDGARSRVVDTILARVLMILKRFDEAEQVLLTVLDRFGPDKWVHYYLATVYEELDRIPETEQHLKACLALDPDSADALNFLGYMYAEENTNLDEAEALLNHALSIDPENGAYLDSLGWVYYRKGDADRAIELIRKAILNMTTDDAILRDHLGDAYLLKGDVDKAVAQWERARRLDPLLEGVQDKLDEHSGF